MSHNHSPSLSRAGTPAACVGRDAFLNIAEGEQQSLNSFHPFGYEDHLGPFNLTAVSVGARPDGGTNQLYGPSAAVQQPNHFPGGGAQPVFHSPLNSPSPQYVEFNPFPLSPPHSGGQLLSFVDQQGRSYRSALGPTHHQPLSPLHLSSPLHQTSLDTSRSPTLQPPSHPHHQRRDSYSTSIDRRHSSASATSLRNFQPSPSFSNHDQLASSGVTAQSSSLCGPSIPEESSSRPSNLCVNTSRSTGSGSSGNQSPSGMITRRPAANTNMTCLNMTMGPPLLPPAKTGTRQYRKKTPPEACVICRTNQTPEWRKGPSGLRTLCNACGLTAAKLPSPEPTTIEEVWKQLNDVGRNRFKGHFILTEEQKAMAAQSWANQGASNSNRSAHASRPRMCSVTLNSSQKPSKNSPRRTDGCHIKPPATHGNPADMDAAQQLYSMSRGRGRSLEGSINPLGLGNPYGSPSSSHPDPLELNDRFQHMTCTTADFSGLSPTLSIIPGCSPNGLSSGHYRPSPLLTPEEHHQHHMLGLYHPPALTAPSNTNSGHGRRNSIGGHRMAISSIINEDPPSRPTSGINSDTHLHSLHDHHLQHMNSLLSQHSSQVGYPKQV